MRRDPVHRESSILETGRFAGALPRVAGVVEQALRVAGRW
jgi:hypothetical protein